MKRKLFYRLDFCVVSMDQAEFDAVVNLLRKEMQLLKNGQLVIQMTYNPVEDDEEEEEKETVQ